MAASSRTADQVTSALSMVEHAGATAAEKAEMLMEIAMTLQQKPKHASDIEAAIRLYRLGLDLLSPASALLAARLRARLATALMAMPSDDPAWLEEAREAIESALATFVAEGLNTEIAESEMNLGLALQNLAGMGRARIQDAIAAYQRSLRTFDKRRYAKEYAILQNNLATAFLSIPFTSDAGKMREALAVQAFEEGLSVVTLIDHPVEYAMLQNNLGNALQYVASSHRFENGFRALEAYAEALKVRTRAEMPEEYANTIANKANCLANLPDDPDAPDNGNQVNLRQALDLLREAGEIFQRRGAADKAARIAEAMMELQASLTAGAFGMARA